MNFREFISEEVTNEVRISPTKHIEHIADFFERDL